MEKADILLQKLPAKTDGILFTSNISQFYYTGFDYSDGYLLITRKNRYLITDFRYEEAAKKTAGDKFKIVIFKKPPLETVRELLINDGVKSLAIEEDDVSFSFYEIMSEVFSGIKLCKSKNVTGLLRRTKSEYEAECIKKAQRIAERSLKELLGRITPEMKEKDVAALLEYIMKKNGSEKPSFDTIAISGKASSMPHGVPRNKRIENGFLTIDFGAVYKGYHSDMTRTFCIGKPTNEMKKVYRTVLEAQEKSLELIFSGERNCVKIDRAARDIIYGAGYAGKFGHGLGHGVGLEIHESPRLSPSCKKNDILKDGDIVTVEPGIYLENQFGVRIEDMVYITPEKAVDLTRFTKKLIEI